MPDEGSKEDPSEQAIPEPDEPQPWILKKMRKPAKNTAEDKELIKSQALKNFNSMVENFEKLLAIKDIYADILTERMISPNKLQDRFKPEIRLIHTALEERIAEEIERGKATNKRDFYITGPIGIGKSHALLAKALKLRKEPKENIVIYINNPSIWRNNKYLYFVQEIMYAMMPFQEQFTSFPARLNIKTPDVPPKDNALFNWYYLLMYTCLWQDLHNREELQARILEEFLKDITTFASLMQLTIYFISDQENLFRNPNELKFNQDRFPFDLRFSYGDYHILTASANNVITDEKRRFPSVEIFERLTGEEMKALVVNSFGNQDLSETDHLFLYEACKGNPLEASEILHGFEEEIEIQGYEKGQYTLREYLPGYFQTACSKIETFNRAFLQGRMREESKDTSSTKALPFEEEFQYVLLHLDAETNTEKANIRPLINRAMNRQYMVINKKTKSLESLFPAAAYAMSQLRKPNFLEADIKRILEHPEEYTNDTVGRFLERYILLQLEKPFNSSKTFKIKYFDTQKSQGEFALEYMKVVRIRLGEIVPNKPFANTLFIPNNPTYPCVDLLFYNDKEHMLYPIQITVSLPSHKASHGDFIKTFFDLWKEKFDKGRSDSKELKMQWIWIGGKWDARSLSPQTDPLPIASQTAGSWTIDFQQLPKEILDIAKTLPQITMTESIPKQLPTEFQVDNFHQVINVRLNTTEGTFKTNFQKTFPEEIKNLEGIIKIDYVKSEIQNIKEGTAIFHFSEQRDVDRFIRYFDWKKVDAKNYEEAKNSPDCKANIFTIQLSKA